MNWPVVSQLISLGLHHLAFPRYSDQLAGGEGRELQGEGGVVVISPIEPFTGCHNLRGEIECLRAKMLAQASLASNFKMPFQWA